MFRMYELGDSGGSAKDRRWRKRHPEIVDTPDRRGEKPPEPIFGSESKSSGIRKFRIFVVELVLVGSLVGWLLLRAPDQFDQFIPWIVTAIVIHLCYECLWDSESGRRWRQKEFRSQRVAALFFVVIVSAVSIPLWIETRIQVIKLTHHPVIASTGKPDPSIPSGTGKPAGNQIPLYPAITDTIILASEFDFPTFWAKCSVPCFFKRGVVEGSESKMVELPRDKDLTVTQVRVVDPVRLKKGQKVILEYMAFGGGEISLKKSGRKFSNQSLSAAMGPCPRGRIHVGEMINNNVKNGIVTQGEVPCIEVDKETTTNGEAGLNVNPQDSSAKQPPK